MKVASTSRRRRANRSPSTTAATLGRRRRVRAGSARHQQGHDHGGERDDVDRVRGGDARDRDDDPADRGTDDGGGVEHQLVEADRGLQPLDGDEARDRRGPGRLVDRPEPRGTNTTAKMAAIGGAGVSAITASARLQPACPSCVSSSSRRRSTASATAPPPSAKIRSATSWTIERAPTAEEVAGEDVHLVRDRDQRERPADRADRPGRSTGAGSRGRAAAARGRRGCPRAGGAAGPARRSSGPWCHPVRDRATIPGAGRRWVTQSLITFDRPCTQSRRRRPDRASGRR